MVEFDVSIIIEGYNETLDIGALDETLEALRRQDYPLARVEVLLVGAPGQTAAWEPIAADPAPFGAVRLIPADGAHYYQLKNLGAERARAPILAMLDSDVSPEAGWLTALTTAIAGGAEATCGPSLFRQGPAVGLETAEGAIGLPRLLAASISWGFIVGPGGEARGFLSHNLGIRKDVFVRLRYPTEFGRTCAGSILHEGMRKAGTRLEFVDGQRVAHAFRWRWWSTRLHVRFGHEMYLLHRMEPTAVSAAARYLGPFDAIATPVWHVLLDFPRWWRYSGVLGQPVSRRVAGFLLLLPVSMLGRGAEMAGMLGTLFAPGRMREFAAQN